MFLLDTNIVSELRSRKSANPGVLAWASEHELNRQFLSVVTLLELELGIFLKERKDAAQGEVLRTWLSNMVLPRFSDRILDIDRTVALRCAALHVPDPLPERDAMIAATALVHGMTLVTRNVRDFETTGVRLLNPWS
jgi:hypothetical protein